MAIAGLTNEPAHSRLTFTTIGFVFALCFPSQNGCASESASESASISFHARTTHGDLSACEVVFVASGVDTHYKRPPSTVVIGGSLFFTIRADGTAVELFKVCGIDTASGNEQFKIHYAYPIIDGTAIRNFGEARETIDGCHLAIFSATNLMMRDISWDFSNMKVAYSRKEEGQDVVVDLTHDASQLNEMLGIEQAYARCTSELMERRW